MKFSSEEAFLNRFRFDRIAVMSVWPTVLGHPVCVHALPSTVGLQVAASETNSAGRQFHENSPFSQLNAGDSFAIFDLKP